MDIAEAKLGKAPSQAQILAVLYVDFWNPCTQGMTLCFLQNLYREDFFYADKMFNTWSTNKNGKGKETMELFSERFRRLYPGYMLDKNMRIRA